ncbi:hypothetical protein [Haladaptatus sp. DFWS20]|uniref:hypothetical protein n=1 Tax=Haladaptatus sp. DFWS20 TaxID=3403467 RepID=UPI003EC11A19
MPRTTTDLPFGDAFSPAQLSVEDDEEELVVVLDLIEQHEGDPDAFDAAIADRFFSDSPDPLNRAKNVRLGVSPVGYEITDEDFMFTDLGQQLNELKDKQNEMYDHFARHILLNLHGLEGIEIVEDLEAEGKRTINANIKQEYRDQYGYHIDGTSNHWSQMRAWMAKAGIVNTRSHKYDIDRARIDELIGVSKDDTLALESLDPEPTAFLRALALINPPGKIRNSVVRKVAEEAYGVSINQSNISKRVLNPLEEEGYIEWEHRDGKANRIHTTDKFDADVLKPTLESIAQRSGIPRSVLRKSYDELMEEMDSDSTYEKGTALETVAIKLGRLIGLDFVGWRVRSVETNGSEIDVVMDDVGKAFTRWQIQCKNTKSELTRDHVAREVGISRTLQTNVLLMIGRGGVSKGAELFAAQVMQSENITILFLTGEELEQLDERPDVMIHELRGQSNRVQRIKRLRKDRRADEGEDAEEVREREERALDEYEEELSEYQPRKDTNLTEFIEEEDDEDD